jgi:hypothetical protein
MSQISFRYPTPHAYVTRFVPTKGLRFKHHFRYHLLPSSDVTFSERGVSA